MTRYLCTALALAIAGSAHTEQRMAVGDSRIDGRKIAPYTHSWQQCMKQDDQWVDAGTVSETLTIIGEQVLRHRQVTTQPNGVVSTAITYFERASFAPLRIETEVVREGQQLAYSERVLTADGYTGYSEKDGQRTELAGTISSGMLHGMVMGLPLAAIEPPDKPLRFLASMVSFDGTYEVVATWSGTETLRSGDTRAVSFLVDVEWHHRESGDVYPAGPDASGGRFWIVPDPPPGLPYVPRYQTDSYLVDFRTCAT